MSALAWLIVSLALVAVFYIGYRLGRLMERMKHSFGRVKKEQT